MDKDQLPRLEMDEPVLVDRNARSGWADRSRLTLRRWIPPALRTRLPPSGGRRSAPPPARYARSRMAHGDPDPPRTWTRTLSWQISACMLVCLLVIGMKMINIPATQAVLDGLDYAVNTPTDIDGLGKLKFIDSLIDKSAAVFSGVSDEEPAFGWPARGEVAGTFIAEDTSRQGIVIGAGAGAAVAAVLDGQVFYVGENSRWGRYVRMRHAGGWDTIYGHVAPSVKTGQDVLAGETLGQCVDGELLFEIWRESVPVDPLTLLPELTDA